MQIRHLGLTDYTTSWEAMRAFTAARPIANHTKSDDEIWFTEHPPIFTLGQAGRTEHILDAGNIPLLRTDRGGQVTYHGHGQLLAYVLINLKARGFGVRELVHRLEQAIIDTLAEYTLQAERKSGAPGVYLNGAKIASLGLRIRQGYSYHGLALNVDMDLSPFSRINPCGFTQLPITQLRDHHSNATMADATSRLARQLIHQLDSTH